MTYRFPPLSDVVATLQLEQADEHRFTALQLDNPSHHIAGGHIAAPLRVRVS
ncbi:MAG: hypothetical protein WCE30_17965 [Mycobacterium sp.]